MRRRAQTANSPAGLWPGGAGHGPLGAGAPYHHGHGGFGGSITAGGGILATTPYDTTTYDTNTLNTFYANPFTDRTDPSCTTPPSTCTDPTHPSCAKPPSTCRDPTDPSCTTPATCTDATCLTTPTCTDVTCLTTPNVRKRHLLHNPYTLHRHYRSYVHHNASYTKIIWQAQVLRLSVIKAL